MVMILVKIMHKIISLNWWYCVEITLDLCWMIDIGNLIWKEGLVWTVKWWHY